ncbi:type III-B CRISPR module-associated protein Cmr5 [Desulfofundulus sp. TPOSR]|uniref:type III-B CRISPR module-associated protein Cmr5 n=1 Tax=Desulfofundulus sp. TPOSR TaxID=2714340 RepID=UPI001408D363|nr:type III-B CRISPR module-associated protein Cmr5 [Desulfofundulus sp. TPOSR]NHM27879.1 type III-B CRISPR module-associated protein Cmr5 [Desulfofundulus sp. TPOSR]
MSVTGIENGRARFAFDCAREGSGLERKKEYRGYVRKIPALIKTNGLGATLAFIAAKKKEHPADKEYAYKVIYEQIGRWLRHQGLIEDSRPLEEQVISLDSATYRVVTNEVLALVRWLSRFAETLIEGESND